MTDQQSPKDRAADAPADDVRAALIAALQAETDPGVRVAIQTALVWIGARLPRR